MMGLFKRTPEELEQKVDSLKAENEVLSHEQSIAEKKAVIRQLKREHGTDWMKVLGLNRMPSLSTLRSFLQSANKGIKGSGGALNNPNLDPRVRSVKGVKKLW